MKIFDVEADYPILIHRNGVRLGHLWVPWRPRFDPRNLFVGVRLEERYWEMGEHHQTVRVHPLPMVTITLDWTLKP